MSRRVAVVGGHGKTGRAVADALLAHGAGVVTTGRTEHDGPVVRLAAALEGCDAAYLIAPNLHPDEPAYVAHALEAARLARMGRVVYHSVASPYAPTMPHHLGKAIAEDLVRRSGLAWTILQPGPYLQNLDLSATVRVPYRADVTFGFADLADVGEAAAVVLLQDGHAGATYELATRSATVAELAAEAGVEVVVDRDWDDHGLTGRERDWLTAMFDHYDAYGLPVGTLPLRALLRRTAPEVTRFEP